MTLEMKALRKSIAWPNSLILYGVYGLMMHTCGTQVWFCINATPTT
jgi:hypothetical protein